MNETPVFKHPIDHLNQGVQSNQVVIDHQSPESTFGASILSSHYDEGAATCFVNKYVHNIILYHNTFYLADIIVLLQGRAQ